MREGPNFNRPSKTLRLAAGTADAPLQRMDKTAEDLKIRTKRFAVKILEFTETLPSTAGASAVARQLARAGMGVAGNYRSSCRARSHAEFTARPGVVLEEADESELWLDVANDKHWGTETDRIWLLREAGELRAIFSKACSTARAKEHRT